MTVHRRHIWTLDDATRDSGVVIAPAGGGLPRRITGGYDYAAAVLALAPSGFWRLDELSGPYLDRTAHAIHWEGSSSYCTRGVGGHGRGGDAGASVFGWTYFGAQALSLTPLHQFTGGQPFSLALWVHRSPSYDRIIDGWAGYVGWSLWLENNQVTFRATLDASHDVRITSGPVAHCVTDPWRLRHVVVTYTGGYTDDIASWSFYVDGNPFAPAFQGAPSRFTGLCASTMPPWIGTALGASWIHAQDVAIWSNRCLTAAEVKALVDIEIGRMHFARAFTAPVTLRGLQVPGNDYRDEASSTRSRRIYFHGGAAGEVECEPEADPAYVIASGETANADVRLIHPWGAPLPYVGDALGGGPALVYEEADPEAPVAGNSISGTGWSNREEQPVTVSKGIDLALTADGELDLSWGTLNFLDGREAIRQDVSCACRFFRGEWFLDLDRGIPYFEAILVKGPKLGAVREAFAEAILARRGVKSILSLDLDYRPAERALTVSFRADTDLGEITGKVPVEVTA